MQDVQNIPVPNENSNDVDEELGSHSGLQPESPDDSEVNPNSDDDTGKAVPLPTDREPFPKNEGVPDDEGDAERRDIEQI